MEPIGGVRSVHDVAATRLAAALVVGAVLSVDPAGLWPFGPLRWLVVSAVAIVLWAAALWSPGPAVPRRMFHTWCLLLVLLGAAGIVNHDVWVAITGTATRHFGWLTWLLCCGLFCAGARLVERHDELQRACTVAIAFIGVWCAWELAFGPPVALAAHTDRLLGPFGSAAMLGAATCLLLPSAVALALDRVAPVGWRATAIVASMLGAVAAAGSGTRAAWFGLAVAAVIVLSRVRPSRRVLACSIGVLLVAGLAASPWLGRVADRAEGAGSRVDEWVVGARVLAHHPLLGTGPEGYRIVADDGIDAGYERRHPRDVVLPDRAHSAPLDVALAGGILAALAYLALVGGVWVRAIRLVERSRPAATGLAAGVLAYSAAQLFLFPLAELDPLWWLLAGSLVAVPPAQRARERGRRATIALVAGVCTPVVLVTGLLDVSANRLAKQATTASAEGDDGSANDLAARAARLRPDATPYRMVAVQVLLTSGSLTAIDAAIHQAREAVRWSPRDPIAVDLLATALLQRAVATGADDDVAAALAAWQALVERDPHRARWQLMLGRAAAQANDTALAQQAWSAAAELGSAEAVALLAGLAEQPSAEDG
jgi:O-antigen ligase